MSMKQAIGAFIAAIILINGGLVYGGRKMVQIVSERYICGGSDQGINAGLWWTEPISSGQKPGVYYFCGGNVATEDGSSKGFDSCKAVDVNSCSTYSYSVRMSTPRQALQPNCLTNGQCILFGGNTSASMADMVSVDIFSPEKLKMKKASYSMPEPRLCHAAALLEDNGSDVLVTGGYGVKDPKTGRGPVLASAVLLNVVTGKALPLRMNHQRGGHSITKLSDGTFLVLGGVGDDSKGAEIFDPKTNKFTEVESKMKFGRKDHRAVKAHNGKVYIVGGTDGSEQPVEIEVFDPKTKTFKRTGLKISEGREDLAVVYVPQYDLIIAAGGEMKGKPGEPESKAVDVIDLANRKVTSGELTVPRDEPSLVLQKMDREKGIIYLLSLTGQRKVDGTEKSLPVESIRIVLDQ